MPSFSNAWNPALWNENSLQPVASSKAKPDRTQVDPARHGSETDAVAERHNLYTADRWRTRVYYADYRQKREVMRATSSRIGTKLDDQKTVSMMIDLAQSRDWKTVKLRGSESFKREAWVQAQVRGMNTEGYRPTTTDMQEAERREAAVAPVDQSVRAAAKAPQRAESTAAKLAAAPRERQSQKQTKQPPANGRQPDGFWDAQRAQIDPDQAAQSREVKSSSGMRM